MPKKKAAPLDPVTAYATTVVAGAVVASRMVRMACQRHLDDLNHQASKGLIWKPEKAQEPIDFFAEILCLPEHTDADEVASERVTGEARPFVLEPWQQFVVGSLFGWYTDKGFRRFREAYIETAKGSGKTPLGAGIMLYLLVADGEKGAQIFAAAVTREQAGLAFRDAVSMVEASPHLKDLIDQRVNNLAVLEDGSFFRPVSSEKRGLDGKRVHGALIDELHEHATPVVVTKMRAGTKGRRNALIVKITNSGFDRSSVCWNHHEYSRKVLEGSVTGAATENWFAFVCGLDPCATCAAAGKWFPSDDCVTCDSWKVEGPHWLKANPNLGVSLPWQYVRERVGQAIGMPSEVSDVLRFNFCVWTQGFDRAIQMDRWTGCPFLPKASELLSARCFGGLDLGETDDFTAWVILWELEDGRVSAKFHYWIPDVAIERFPNRPYEEWQRQPDLLTVTEGDVTDYAQVRERILSDCQKYGLQAVAFDTKSARETAQLLIAEGIDMVPTTQGFPLNEAIKKMLELIASGEMAHAHDPITTLMASNLVLVTGAKNERRIAKERAPDKIDGMAALAMAIDWGLVRNAGGDVRPSDPEVLYV